MALVSAKAFVAVDDIGSRGNTAGSKVGGRLDVSRSIEDIHFTASVTDSTVRGYEDLNDLLVTGSKKINSNLDLTLGYDAGVKGAFASVTGNTNVSNKDARATATWFQKGNHVRTEASIALDGRSSLWGTYTFNDNANLVNSTYINLKEREGFILRPFTIPISTAAAKYTLERDGYIAEASVDLNKQAPYVSLQKRRGNNTFKGHYAFKEEYALLEVGYARATDDLPLVKGYFKGPLGRSGLGPLSVGFIFDKTLDV